MVKLMDEPPPSKPPEGTTGERPLRASDLFPLYIIAVLEFGVR